MVLKGEFRDALQLSLKEPNFAARLFSVAAAAGAAGGGMGAVTTAVTGAAGGVVGGAPGGGAPGMMADLSLANALNNADVSAEYAMKLRNDVEEFCNEVRHEKQADGLVSPVLCIPKLMLTLILVLALNLCRVLLEERRGGVLPRGE